MSCPSNLPNTQFLSLSIEPLVPARGANQVAWENEIIPRKKGWKASYFNITCRGYCARCFDPLEILLDMSNHCCHSSPRSIQRLQMKNVKLIPRKVSKYPSFEYGYFTRIAPGKTSLLDKAIRGRNPYPEQPDKRLPPPLGSTVMQPENTNIIT